MKKINFIFVLLSFLFAASNFSLAQQDYQIVQKFKHTSQEILKEIQEANSLAQLDSIQNKIDMLKNENMDHKELLDKSLYPDDFNSSLAKLNDELTLRKGDFTQISTLKTQVSQLQIQIDSLNAKNAALMSQVEQLEEQGNKDKETIAHLQRNVSELRYSLRKRDRLLMTMLDSLMPSSYKESGKLTGKEKQQIYSEAEKTNIISNIKKAIQENIQFLEVTNLSPNDISVIKKQQMEFEKLWRNVGPQIIDIYSARRKNVENLKEIDKAFNDWHNALNQEAWNSIRKDFSDHGINLNTFSSGEEFTNIVTSYIGDEIKNVKIAPDEVKQNYHAFVDSVWFASFKPNWVPYLDENNMLTTAQTDTVEAKIAQWKAEVMPSSFTWLYIIIAIIIIFAIVFWVRSKSSKKPKSDVASESNE